MKGLSKGDSLDLLRNYGMNTPIFRVFKKPFNREEMILTAFEFPGNISVRTWNEGKIMCPFFPNQLQNDIPRIIDGIFANYQVEEIIFSEGIDPHNSLKCGKVTHLRNLGYEAYAAVEYFEGPGTVRELDNKPNGEVNRIKVSKYNQPNNENEWISDLVRKCRILFQAYPGTTVEWSIYSTDIGTKRDKLIFWEVV